MLAGVGGQLPLQAVQLRLSLEGVLDSSHFKFYATLQKNLLIRASNPTKPVGTLIVTVTEINGHSLSD